MRGMNDSGTLRTDRHGAREQASNSQYIHLYTYVDKLWRACQADAAGIMGGPFSLFVFCDGAIKNSKSLGVLWCFIRVQKTKHHSHGGISSERNYDESQSGTPAEDLGTARQKQFSRRSGAAYVPSRQRPL